MNASSFIFVTLTAILCIEALVKGSLLLALFAGMFVTVVILWSAADV